MKVVISWQLMIWAQAQAGNRASNTGHYLQWRGTGSEWHAETSAVQKLHHSSLLSSLSGLVCSPRPGKNRHGDFEQPRGATKQRHVPHTFGLQMLCTRKVAVAAPARKQEFVFPCRSGRQPRTRTPEHSVPALLWASAESLTCFRFRAPERSFVGPTCQLHWLL